MEKEEIIDVLTSVKNGWMEIEFAAEILLSQNETRKVGNNEGEKEVCYLCKQPMDEPYAERKGNNICSGCL